MDPASIRLRPASSEDLPFLRAVQEAAMRPHAERVYGRWDAAAASKRFEALSDPPPHSIIELDGEAVGVQWVRRHPDALELVQLYLLPDVHNHKIGTQLVTRLLDQADRESLPVRLRVLKHNPARRLYERLGFVITRETETHDYLVCFSSAAKQRS